MKKLLLLSILAVTACETTEPQRREADFWQRSSIESALYMRGPKAQHQLHKDISSCVAEVKELSRLGTIRDANPPTGIEMQKGLAENWQSPKGEGPLHTEFQDFHDFESCMNFKGWERTIYVKPETMERAKTNYNTVILGEKKTVKQDPTTLQSHTDNGAYND